MGVYVACRLLKLFLGKVAPPGGGCYGGQGELAFLHPGGGSVLQVVCAVSHTPTPTHRTHTGSEGTKGPKMSTSKFGWVDLDRDSNQPPAGRGLGRSFCNGQSSRPRTMHPPPGLRPPPLLEAGSVPDIQIVCTKKDCVSRVSHQKILGTTCVVCTTNKNFVQHCVYCQKNCISPVCHQQKFCVSPRNCDTHEVIVCSVPTLFLEAEPRAGRRRSSVVWGVDPGTPRHRRQATPRRVHRVGAGRHDRRGPTAGPQLPCRPTPAAGVRVCMTHIIYIVIPYISLM